MEIERLLTQLFSIFVQFLPVQFLPVQFPLIQFQELLDANAFLTIVSFFVAWLVLWLPIALPLTWKLKWRPGEPLTMAQKLPLLASLYLLAPLLLWGFAGLAQQPFSAYGLPWNLAVLVSGGKGLLLGVLGLGVLFAIELTCGWMTVQKPQEPILPMVVTTLLLGLWVSLTEELIFRGFLLNQLQQELQPWMAGAIASLIFALLHLVWEGKANIPQLPGLWLMGMVLTLARGVDGGNLGLAWGLHAGWIWTIATLDTTRILVYPGKVSAWITGLDQKPLAGIMGILFLLGTAGVLGWMFSG
ncbi:MAG: CPBP family intramembrane metalloprotease [Oculatellaceae cyanobacterium Prado106]|jgi:hypothetical protein|nr:CPBP family intramembrane metalloprotease [Oculatellaceae cyanobacterium Prado106]